MGVRDSEAKEFGIDFEARSMHTPRERARWMLQAAAFEAQPRLPGFRQAQELSRRRIMGVWGTEAKEVGIDFEARSIHTPRERARWTLQAAALAAQPRLPGARQVQELSRRWVRTVQEEVEAVGAGEVKLEEADAMEVEVEEVDGVEVEVDAADGVEVDIEEADTVEVDVDAVDAMEVNIEEADGVEVDVDAADAVDVEIEEADGVEVDVDAADGVGLKIDAADAMEVEVDAADAVDVEEADDAEIGEADGVVVEEPAEQEAIAEAVRRLRTRSRRWHAYSRLRSSQFALYTRPLQSEAPGLTLREMCRRTRLVARLIKECFAVRHLQAAAREFLQRHRGGRERLAQEQLVHLARQEAAAHCLKATTRQFLQ